MNSQPRLTLIPVGFYRASWLGVIILVPMGACLFGLGLWGDTSDLLLSSAAVLVGFALVTFAYAQFRMKRKRETVTVQARVFKRYKEKQKVKAGGGSSELVGLALEVLVVGLQEVKPSYDHVLELEFEVTDTGGLRRDIALRAIVTDELYEQYAGGSVIGVMYAATDPRMAILEGEKGFEVADSIDRIKMRLCQVYSQG